MDRDLQDLIDLYGLHSPVLDSTPNCDQTSTTQHILDTDIPLHTPHFEDCTLDLPSPLLPFTPDITRIFSFDIQDIIAAEENNSTESNSSSTTPPALPSEDSTLSSTQSISVPEAVQDIQELLPPAPPQTPVDKSLSPGPSFSGPSNPHKVQLQRQNTHYRPPPILPKFAQQQAQRSRTIPNIPIPVQTFYLDIKPIPLLNLQVKPTQQFALTNSRSVPFKKRRRFN